MTCIVKRTNWILVFLFISLSNFVFPQNADDLFISGQEYLIRGEYEKALLSIDHVLAIDSSITDYYLLRANIYFKMKVYDKTIRDCYTILKLRSDIPEVYILRGKVCQVTESYGGAILFFGKAIKYSSENESLFEAFLNRGKAYFELRKYYDAKNDFISAYEINQNSLDLLLSMSENYLMINDNKNAFSTLSIAIEIDSLYPPSYALLGSIAINNKNYSEAIIAYKKYCELIPEMAMAYNMLGETYLLNKEYENAMNTINISQSISPNDPMIFKIKGLIYVEQKEYDKGCNNLFRALQLGYLEQYGYDLLEVYLNECEDQ